jgi:hypothetical protein
MKKFGLLIPKYIFVQYQYLLLTKFGPLIPKYIFVICVYLLLIAVLILTRILTPSRLYLIDMGNEGLARDSCPPPPHPPGNLFLTGKSDESR